MEKKDVEKLAKLIGEGLSFTRIHRDYFPNLNYNEELLPEIIKNNLVSNHAIKQRTSKIYAKLSSQATPEQEQLFNEHKELFEILYSRCNKFQKKVNEIKKIIEIDGKNNS